MKYLQLKFEHARLITGRAKKKPIGTNRFFHPLNNKHIYNSVCVLFDIIPKPQLRETDDKYMPLHEDILSVVNEGYVKIKCIAVDEKNTIVKKAWNANTNNHTQYTWKNCHYLTGTLFPKFINHVSKILKISQEDVRKKAFDDVISEIQSMGFRDDKNEIIYDDDNVNNLISWCNINKLKPMSNYIKDRQLVSRNTSFGKRVNRGCELGNKYSGIIYIPLNDDLFDELVTYTKGFSTILDGGLVTITGYGELMEDDIEGFTKIKELKSIRKFYDKTKSLVIDNTIYKDLDENNLQKSMDKIIKKCGVSIKDNQKSYDEMLKRSLKLDIRKIIPKLNYFIEDSINKQYK